MTSKSDKKIPFPKLELKQPDLSHIKPPKRLAVEAMIENLHNADSKKSSANL